MYNNGLHILNNTTIADAASNPVVTLSATSPQTFSQITSNNNTLAALTTSSLNDSLKNYIYSYDATNAFAPLAQNIAIGNASDTYITMTVCYTHTVVVVLKSKSGYYTLYTINQLGEVFHNTLVLSQGETVISVACCAIGITLLTSQNVYIFSSITDTTPQKHATSPATTQVLACGEDGTAALLHGNNSSYTIDIFLPDNTFTPTHTVTTTAPPTNVLIGNAYAVFVQAGLNIYRADSSASFTLSVGTTFVGMTLCDNILVCITRTNNNFFITLLNASDLTLLVPTITMQPNDIVVSLACCEPFFSIEAYNAAINQNHVYVIDMDQHAQIVGPQAPASPNLPFVSLACCPPHLALLIADDNNSSAYDLHILSQNSDSSLTYYSTADYDNSNYDSACLITFSPVATPQRLVCTTQNIYVAQSVLDGKNYIYFLACDNQLDGTALGNNGDTVITLATLDTYAYTLLKDANGTLKIAVIDASTKKILSSFSGTFLPSISAVMVSAGCYCSDVYNVINTAFLSGQLFFSADTTSDPEDITQLSLALRIAGCPFTSVITLLCGWIQNPDFTNSFVSWNAVATLLPTILPPIFGVTQNQVNQAIAQSECAPPPPVVSSVIACSDLGITETFNVSSLQTLCATTSFGFVWNEGDKLVLSAFNAINYQKSGYAVFTLTDAPNPESVDSIISANCGNVVAFYIKPKNSSTYITYVVNLLNLSDTTSTSIVPINTFTSVPHFSYCGTTMLVSGDRKLYLYDSNAIPLTLTLTGASIKNPIEDFVDSSCNTNMTPTLAVLTGTSGAYTVYTINTTSGEVFNVNSALTSPLDLNTNGHMEKHMLYCKNQISIVTSSGSGSTLEHQIYPLNLNGEVWSQGEFGTVGQPGDRDVNIVCGSTAFMVGNNGEYSVSITTYEFDSLFVIKLRLHLDSTTSPFGEKNIPIDFVLCTDANFLFVLTKNESTGQNKIYAFYIDWINLAGLYAGDVSIGVPGDTVDEMICCNKMLVALAHTTSDQYYFKAYSVSYAADLTNDDSSQLPTDLTNFINDWGTPASFDCAQIDCLSNLEYFQASNQNSAIESFTAIRTSLGCDCADTIIQTWATCQEVSLPNLIWAANQANCTDLAIQIEGVANIPTIPYGTQQTLINNLSLALLANTNPINANTFAMPLTNAFWANNTNAVLFGLGASTQTKLSMIATGLHTINANANSAFEAIYLVSGNSLPMTCIALTSGGYSCTEVASAAVSIANPDLSELSAALATACGCIQAVISLSAVRTPDGTLFPQIQIVVDLAQTGCIYSDLVKGLLSLSPAPSNTTIANDLSYIPNITCLQIAYALVDGGACPPKNFQTTAACLGDALYNNTQGLCDCDSLYVTLVTIGRIYFPQLSSDAIIQIVNATMQNLNCPTPFFAFVCVAPTSCGYNQEYIMSILDNGGSLPYTITSLDTQTNMVTIFSGTIQNTQIFTEYTQDELSISCCFEQITISAPNGQYSTFNFSSGNVVETSNSVCTNESVVASLCCGAIVTHNAEKNLYNFNGTSIFFGLPSQEFVSAFCCDNDSKIFVLLQDSITSHYFLYTFNNQTGIISQAFTSFKYVIVGEGINRNILFVSSATLLSAVSQDNYTVCISLNNPNYSGCVQNFSSNQAISSLIECGNSLYAVMQDAQSQQWLYSFNQEGTANPALGFPIGDAGTQLIITKCCATFITVVLYNTLLDIFQYLAFNISGEAVALPNCCDACFPTLEDFTSANQYAQFLLSIGCSAPQAFAALTDNELIDVIPCDMNNNGIDSVAIVTQDELGQLYTTLFAPNSGPYNRLLGTPGDQYLGAHCCDLSESGNWSILLATGNTIDPVKFSLLNAVGQLERLCPEKIIECTSGEYAVFVTRRSTGRLPELFYFMFSPYVSTASTSCDILPVRHLCCLRDDSVEKIMCCGGTIFLVYKDYDEYILYFFNSQDGAILARTTISSYKNSFCCNASLYVIDADCNFIIYSNIGTLVPYTIIKTDCIKGNTVIDFEVNNICYTLTMKPDGSLLNCPVTCHDNTSTQEIICDNKNVTVTDNNGQYYISGDNITEQPIGQVGDVLIGLWCCEQEALVLMQQGENTVLYRVNPNTGSGVGTAISINTATCKTCPNKVSNTAYYFSDAGAFSVFMINDLHDICYCPSSFGDSTNSTITNVFCYNNRVSFTTTNTSTNKSLLYIVDCDGTLCINGVPIRDKETCSRFMKRTTHHWKKRS